MSADRGGDRNPKFERVQACILLLVMKITIDNLSWVNTAIGGSAWNPSERTMAAMIRAFKNALIRHVETKINLGQELIHKKS